MPLASMTQAVDVSGFESVLARLQDDGPALFGSDRVVLTPRIRMTRRGSELLRVEVTAGADTSFLYAKRYRLLSNSAERLASLRRRVVVDYEANKRIFDGLSTSEGLGAVRPLACFPDELTIVTQEARGETLARYLETRLTRVGRQTRDDAAAIVKRVGLWLRAFQRLDAKAGSISLPDVREYLDHRLRKLVGIGELSGGMRESLLDCWERKAALVSARDLDEVPIHADYCLGNVLVDRGRIVVLDFAMAKRGSRYHDISHMFFQIEMMQAKPWYRRAETRSWLPAMLESFEPGLDAQRPVFELFLMQHVVCHLTKLASRANGSRLVRAYRWYLRQRHHAWLENMTAAAR